MINEIIEHVIEIKNNVEKIFLFFEINTTIVCCCPTRDIVDAIAAMLIK